MRLSKNLVAALCLTILMAGCASRPVVEDGILINDPYEAQNRRIHAFNKALDARVIGPVARLAGGQGGDGTEGGGRTGQTRPVDLVVNMGANLSLPGKVVNSLLQGRPAPAVQNLFRFAVNSTLGLAGMFDPAGNDFGLTETDTDFGETLAVWGLPEGAYLELPVLGPSTARDATGKLVDLLIDPLGQVLDKRQRAVVLGLRIGSKAGERSRFGDTVDSVLRDSADSYSQLRLIYLMHRRHSVGEEEAEFDPYDDPEGTTSDEAGFIDPYAD